MEKLNTLESFKELGRDIVGDLEQVQPIEVPVNESAELNNKIRKSPSFSGQHQVGVMCICSGCARCPMK